MTAHRTGRLPLSTAAKTLRLGPILDSDHGLWSGHTTRFRPGLAIDTPYAAHRKWRWRTGGRGYGGVRRLTQLPHSPHSPQGKLDKQ